MPSLHHAGTKDNCFVKTFFIVLKSLIEKKPVLDKRREETVAMGALSWREHQYDKKKY